MAHTHTHIHPLYTQRIASSGIYKTRNVTFRKGGAPRGMVDDRDYGSEDHKRKYRNIFQHEFNENSAYCIWEFPYHYGADKVSGVYVLKEIIPCNVWRVIDKHTKTLWEKLQNAEKEKTTRFIQRCVPFADRVKGKKSSKEFEVWQQQLILYEMTVKYLNWNGRKPSSVEPKSGEAKLWYSLERAYLEQYATHPGGPNALKKRKYSMTKRDKMRIAGLVLLLALGAGFWRISVDACKEIAVDLKIPDQVIMGGFGLLGCIQEENVVKMVTKPSLKSPGMGFEGEWWRV